MRCGAMLGPQALCLWVLLAWSCGSARAPAPDVRNDVLGLGDMLFERRCPSYCNCYAWGGLRRADCTERRLLSVDVGLPREVEVADLSGNLISVLDDGSLQEQGLLQLMDLSLRRNAIRSIGLFAFAGLRRLSALDLSHNHLQTLHPNTFAGNRGLKVLLLAGNNFARLASDRPLLSATRLQVLDLSECKLPYLGPAVFSELPALASLNLSGNHLNQLQLSVFQRLGRLQALDADRNPLNCDFSTSELIEHLRKRNITVTQPCPSLSAPSKHLARLLADVVPGVVGDAETVIESNGGDTGHSRSEKMIDLETLMGIKWEPVVDDGEVSGQGDSLDLDIAYDGFRNITPSNNACSPPLSHRESQNPDFFKDYFDELPSFHAMLIGFQAGMTLVALIAMCNGGCRQIRAHCHSRRRNPSAPPAREYFALEVGDNGSPTPTFCRAPAVGVSGADDFSSLSSHVQHDRPETPPPAYSELTWTSEVQVR